MTADRIRRGLKSVRRFPELLRAFKLGGHGIRVALAYLGIIRLEYPTLMHRRQGAAIEIWSWEDLTTVWAVWFGGEYDLRDTDRNIIDLGANIGAFTVLAAESSSRRVIAVEPFPGNFERLKSNLARQRNKSQVVLVEAAADHRQRTLWMSTESEILSHSRTVATSASGKDCVPVKTVTLPELVARLEGRVDFLKVDIEGYEYELFENASANDLLGIHRIGLEYHGQGGAERIQKILGSRGFRLTRHLHHGDDRGIVEMERSKSAGSA